jgi:tetratricopeptide (TPR) repeat protein
LTTEVWFYTYQLIAKNSKLIFIGRRSNGLLPPIDIRSTTAIYMIPNEALNWYHKGVAAYQKLHFESALQAFDQAILLDPKMAKAWYQKGIVLGELEQFDNAINAFDKTLEIDPKHGLAWYNKCNILTRLGRIEETITVCSKALELLAGDAHIWYKKATLHSSKNDKHNTLSTLANAVNQDGNLKERAKKDECFKWLWNDPEFKHIAG